MPQVQMMDAHGAKMDTLLVAAVSLQISRRRNLDPPCLRHAYLTTVTPLVSFSSSAAVLQAFALPYTRHGGPTPPSLQQSLVRCLRGPRYSGRRRPPHRPANTTHRLFRPTNMAVLARSLPVRLGRHRHGARHRPGRRLPKGRPGLETQSPPDGETQPHLHGL